MKTAEVLENTGVHAYSGQALNIKKAAYVKAALSILTIEARHASVIGLDRTKAPRRPARTTTPNGPFDTPLPASKGAPSRSRKPASSSAERLIPSISGLPNMSNTTTWRRSVGDIDGHSQANPAPPPAALQLLRGPTSRSRSLVLHER